MSCAICWDKFEDSACSLNCGHLFHRKCIVNFTRHDLVCPFCGKGDPTASHTDDICEVFFTSKTSTTESSHSSAIGDDACWEDPITTITRLRENNRYLLDDKLRVQKQFEVAAREIKDSIVEAAKNAIKDMAKTTEEKLYELESERRRWESRAKNSESEVALLEAELVEVQQERDVLKKTVRKLKANISNA